MSVFGHLSLLGRDGAFCGSRQPATASGVAIFVCISPSGHVADPQVGEIPGYARLPPPPGWRKCPPLVIVIVSASAEVGRTLRCAYGVSLNRVSVRELSGRIAHIQPSLSALHPSVLACIDACASESSVWTPERYRWWHVARDCRRRRVGGAIGGLGDIGGTRMCLGRCLTALGMKKPAISFTGIAGIYLTVIPLWLTVSSQVVCQTGIDFIK